VSRPLGPLLSHVPGPPGDVSFAPTHPTGLSRRPGRGDHAGALAGPFLDAITTFYGRPDIPIGVVRGGATRDPGAYLGIIRDGDKDRYPHTLKHSADAPDATSVPRTDAVHAEGRRQAPRPDREPGAGRPLSGDVCQAGEPAAGHGEVMAGRAGASAP
jgi:hypothetical protein